MERRRLPTDRKAITRSFKIPHVQKDGTTDTMKFYFTVGLYEDGTPGEIFIRADRTGTLAAGSLDAVAIMMSMLMQYGVPLEAIVSKLRHSRYPPSGWTGDAEFHSCSSPLDLLAQYLEKRFLKLEAKEVPTP